MPTERLAMRKVKEVLRLRWECGLSYRQIVRSCAVGHTTAADYVHRATAAGLSWEPASSGVCAKKTLPLAPTPW